MRRKEPTRFGTAVSQNSSDSDIAMPTLPRLRTMIVHRTQTLKPRFSAKIDKIRFLRAIARPVDAQNASFSGSHRSIQRPRRGARGVSAAVSAGVVALIVRKLG